MQQECPQHTKNAEGDPTTKESIKPYAEVPRTPRFSLELLNDPYRMKQYIKRNISKYDLIYRETSAPGLPEMLFACDPKDIEMVFRSDGKYPQRFPIKEWTQAREELGKPAGLFLSEGEEWHRQRVPMSKFMMMPRKVAEYYKPFNQVSLDFLDLVRQSRGPDDVLLDAPNSLFRWSLESNSLFVLGKRLGCLGTQTPPDCDNFIHQLHIFTSTTQKLLFGLPFHKLWKTKNWKTLVHSLDQLLSFAYRHVNERVEELKDDEKRHRSEESEEEAPVGMDFITYMISAGKMTSESASVNAIDLMTAGIDTTSYTLAACLYSLGTCPETQICLRNEVKEAVGSDTFVTSEHIHKMPYLRDCIKEAQRLYPLAPNNSRLLDHDVVLSGYNIPAGTHIIMPINVAGTLPSYFEEPEKFMPERWSRENKNTPNTFASLPFGFGPRMCVGRRVAELELYISLAHVIRNFKIEYRDEKPMEYISKLFYVPERQLDLAFVDLK